MNKTVNNYSLQLHNKIIVKTAKKILESYFNKLIKVQFVFKENITMSKEN